MQKIMQFISRHLILSITWIGLLAAVLLSTIEHFISKITTITNSEVTRLINQEGAIVIDLRQSYDFCKGHIAGAINLLPVKIKANRLDELEKHKDKPIIVVDDNGLQSQKIASILIKAGFGKVYVLKGGIFGWSSENLPLVHSK